jgi:hypothetical protein
MKQFFNQQQKMSWAENELFMNWGAYNLTSKHWMVWLEKTQAFVPNIKHICLYYIYLESEKPSFELDILDPR